MSEDGTSRFVPTGRYLVVSDGGADEGRIEAGPFDKVTAAIKEKNRLNRESHWMCSYAVDHEMKEVDR
ncbi:hypothetical protein G9C85_02565 [Halorubellus sp. JP-L1]|uniref:hypothetical protein n=1 Tax=Halorubellus sp. JP-L1 TaxID=2715753 RepID=UPI00140DE5DC|nr:hypothetical protein [Halorubellus sp. JP-L1]NHN40521.1 hypothetical protein [Halorubellus sp. JP-L1]